MIGEDPYVYIDSKSHPGVEVHHMLRHCNTSEGTSSTHGQPFGQHAWSLDGGFTWNSYGDEHAYPGWAAFTDAPNQTFDMRERPHLVMAKDGVTPLALTNGAAPNAAWNQRGMWAPCTFHVGGDCREYSYNLLAEINQEAPPPPVPPPSLPRLATASTRGGASCATSSDCGLLGACAASRCVCDAGFTGAACTLPDLGLAQPPGRNALFRCGAPTT